MHKLLLPPIIWLFSIAAMLLTHEIVPIFHIEPSFWRTATGITLLLGAIALTVWHKQLFQRAKTNIDTFGQPDQLVETGLFRYIRNPMYLGFVASLAALALVMGALSPWIWVLGFFLLAHLWYIPFEERAMYKKFGEQYTEYQARTRRWI